MEEGGRIFTIKGIDDKFLPKVVLRVHNPQFYWKVWIVLILIMIRGMFI